MKRPILFFAFICLAGPAWSQTAQHVMTRFDACNVQSQDLAAQVEALQAENARLKADAAKKDAPVQ